MKSSNYQVQMIVSLTPMVKALLIINALVWVFGVVIFQEMILKNTVVFDLFGLSGTGVLENFRLWQPLTYMFLHSKSIWHILFNGLIIWFVGSELEKIWSPREFLKYYLFCGVGAGVLYLFAISVAVNIFGLDQQFLSIPTIGASGAVFGLLMAYGLIFGERVIYFMMLFPMKAKHFILILALVEVFTLITSGFGGAVNNTAHLGGFLMGLIYIYAGKLKMKRMQKKWLKKPGQKLKLVVDNEKKDDKPTFH